MHRTTALHMIVHSANKNQNYVHGHNNVNSIRFPRKTNVRSQYAGPPSMRFGKPS